MAFDYTNFILFSSRAAPHMFQRHRHNPFTILDSVPLSTDPLTVPGVSCPSYLHRFSLFANTTTFAFISPQWSHLIVLHMLSFDLWTI